MTRSTRIGLALAVIGVGLATVFFALQELDVDVPECVLYGILGVGVVMTLGGVVLLVWAPGEVPAASPYTGKGPVIRIPGPDEAQVKQERLNAVHNLLDELASMRLRVKRAIKDGRYEWNFHLPAFEYHEHKDHLARRPRARVSAAYVRADDLQNQIDHRESNGSVVLPEDDLPGLLKLIRAARFSLRWWRWRKL